MREQSTFRVRGSLGFPFPLALALVALLALASSVVAAVAANRASAAEACPNEAFRNGKSASLPDCRAYELVTPADAGRSLLSVQGEATGLKFQFTPMTPDGDAFAYASYEGSFTTGGTGENDTYVSVRTPAGWSLNRQLSPSGEIAGREFPSPGSISPDLAYQFWGANGVAGLTTPGGTFEPIGKGSLGIDPHAKGWWLSPGGAEILFSSTMALEPGVVEGTGIVYRRSVGGPTTVVSLLPGNVFAVEGDAISYAGRSAGGGAVAFLANQGSGQELMVRLSDTRTVLVVGPVPEVSFAGLSADGTDIFYVLEGDIYTENLTSGVTTRITTVGNAELSNISADGSHVYFVSTSVLGEASGPKEGEPNLYVWSRATGVTTYIATVSPKDLAGPVTLTHYLQTVDPERAELTSLGSRTTPDGQSFAFVSHAQLTSYENQGHGEIYLYSAKNTELACASCNPDGTPATHDARFEYPSATGSVAVIGSLTDSGSLFFETNEALVSADTDESNDIYEWSAGTGPILITSGEDVEPVFARENNFTDNNYLLGVSPDGSNVFLATNEAPVPSGPEGVLAIYDARVDGGFPEPPLTGCAGEACQGAPAPQPDIFGAPASATSSGAGNVVPPLVKVAAKPKPPTRAQKLAKALKGCRKEKSRSKRRACDRQARKKYGPKATKAEKAKR